MKSRIAKAALLLGILLSATNVYALPLTLELDTAYATPAVTPVGTTPWLVAQFEDTAPNVVQLTVSAIGLAPGTTQSVGNWLFNFTDSLSLSLLNFQYASGDQASILRGRDLRLAGASRFFDIEFDFAAGQFLPGDQSVYLISSIDSSQPIDSESFSFLSFSASPLVNFYSAAFVEGINGELTSWIAAPNRQTEGTSPVPEPATLLLLGAGLASLGFYGRKRLAR